jgi:nucleoside-diphosphate-sugar epimerase
VSLVEVLFKETLPAIIMDINKHYQSLLLPSKDLASDMATLKGDILILGVGGKMGPALARLAKQAVDVAGVKKRIIGVSRFSEAGLQDELNSLGIETYKADLLQDDQLNALPDAENVLYLAGTKFGTTGRESFTWAMNSYLPARVAQKYKNSRIVVFSTGNVYPFTPVSMGGADESLTPQPVGEYAQSCLGRERLFQHFSSVNNTPILIYRLNYANDITYGVLLEIARLVKEKKPIDLSMGHVNVIWQGDANEIALRALHHCSVSSKILNVTGPETISIRWIAKEFGKLFDLSPEFVNQEQDTALLSNAAECFRLFGYPKVSLKKMMELIVEWINEGGKIINKPTHFQERAGQF